MRNAWPVLVLAACEATAPDRGELAITLALDSAGLAGKQVCYGARVVDDEQQTVAVIADPLTITDSFDEAVANGAHCTSDLETTLTVPCDVGHTYDAKGWVLGIYDGDMRVGTTATCQPGQGVCQASVSCPGSVKLPLGRPLGEGGNPEDGEIEIGVVLLGGVDFVDVCYTLRADDGNGQPLWLRQNFCSSLQGSHDGSIDFYGTCDPDVPPVFVSLWIESMQPANGKEVFNPCPAPRDDPNPWEWKSECMRELPCFRGTNPGALFELRVE